MNTYICAFLGAAFVAMLWTPVVIRLGRAFKVLDHPGVRKIHTSPIPRLGGLALVIPFFALASAVLLLDNQIGEGFRKEALAMAALLGGALAMAAVGLLDDVRGGVRARYKLVAQLVTAFGACLAGIRVDAIHVEGLFQLDLGLWAWPLTMLWIVGMTNAVNLIDGLDGLAAGIAAITVAVVAVIAISIAQPVMAVLMLICFGALLGFLVFNFNPARIFLGDSGTYFLGFLLGAGSLLTSTKSTALIGLTLPLVAMGIPIFDTLFAMLRRTLDRRPIFAPDRNHIHHRLISLGLSQRKAVIVLYVVTLLLTACGMFMMMTHELSSVVMFGCLVVLLVSAFRFLGAIRLRETLAAVKRRRAVGREMNREHEVFQDTDLRMREAAGFDGWWSTLCRAAERFDFASLSVNRRGADGSRETVSWNHTQDTDEHPRCTELSIPITDPGSGLPAELDARVMMNGSVESVGRRVALFSRLLDDGAIDGPRTESTAMSHGRFERQLNTQLGGTSEC